MKLDELAKLAGVSRTTASYVVNGKAKQYRVSEKTIKRVQEFIKEYDFKPNAVAASLRAGKSHTVGMIIPDFENISYAKIANLLENRCREKGYQLLITCSNDDPNNEMECAKHLLSHQVDSLVVSTCLPAGTEFYQQYELPIIGFDRHLTAENAENVLADDENDAYELAKILFQYKQHKNVLFIGALPELAMSQERETGFQRALESYNIQVDYLYAEAFKKQAAQQVFAKWMSQNKLPDAIFSTSLTLLQGVVESLLEKQSIAEKLVFATFGESELVKLLGNPVVSSVQNHHNIVESLLELAISSRKKNKAPPAKIKRQINYHNWS